MSATFDPEDYLTREELEEAFPPLTPPADERERQLAEDVPAPGDEPVNDRPIPHSPEAEAAILGSCLVNPAQVAPVRSIVAPAQFYGRRERMVFETLLEAPRCPECEVLIVRPMTDPERMERGPRLLPMMPDPER